MRDAYCFGGCCVSAGGVVESLGGVSVGGGVSAGGGAAVSGEAGGVVVASPALPPGVADWSPAPDGVVVLSVGGVALRSLHPIASAPAAINGISNSLVWFMSPPGG
jgi:hypothetical protein